MAERTTSTAAQADTCNTPNQTSSQAERLLWLFSGINLADEALFCARGIGSSVRMAAPKLCDEYEAKTLEGALWALDDKLEFVQTLLEGLHQNLNAEVRIMQQAPAPAPDHAAQVTGRPKRAIEDGATPISDDAFAAIVERYERAGDHENAEIIRRQWDAAKCDRLSPNTVEACAATFRAEGSPPCRPQGRARE